MIGKTIYEARRIQGLSQEELAEQSKVSVRTLQRIENDITTPRGKTLNLICDVLNLRIEDLSTHNNPEQHKDYGVIIINYIFLSVLNLLIMSVIGYLTMDTDANFNSKFAAVLLGFFLSYFIVTKTPKLNGGMRLFKYGSGLILYIILATVNHHFPPHLLLGFYPSIGVFLSVLFYGNHLITK